jgi:glycosyltransferase involved in cell wall biosynthesis
LVDAVQQLGVPVAPIPEIDGSLRLHPWHSAEALVQIGHTALRLRVQARRTSAELIHANTIRTGLAAVMARKLGGPPVLVHVRDCLPGGAPANLTRRVLMTGASMLISNSRYTAGKFTYGECPDKTLALHSPVNLKTFSPDRISRPQARRRLGLDDADPVLGVIGQLAPWKAQDDAIRCFAVLRSAWPHARLLVVGNPVFTSKATRFDNRAYAESLHRLAGDLGVGGSVRFLGEREDIPEILRALDVLLVPSWEEPFGRSVIEGMAMQIPVVATSTGGPAEVITDGVDGRLVPPRRPETWAVVVDGLLNSPSRRQEMGRRARATAVRRFGVAAHVAGILQAYERVLGSLVN